MQEVKTAVGIGLLVGFVVGLRDAVGVLLGAYDPWLMSCGLIALYLIVEPLWWAAVLLLTALLLAAARWLAKVVTGREVRRGRVPSWALYSFVAAVGGAIALFAPDLPRRLLESLPIPEGRVRASLLGAAVGSIATILLMFVARISDPGEPHAPTPRRRRLAAAVWIAAGAALVGVGVLGMLSGRPRANPGSSPNVLIISVDALRADAVGSLTPNIGELAARGVTFTEAFAQAPWTLPSLASLMTSRYPSELGIRPLTNDAPGRPAFYPPVASAPRAAEMLREAGYTTAAQLTNPYATEKFGLQGGFTCIRHSQDRPRTPLAYDLLRRGLRLGGIPSERDDADQVTRGALAWLREERREPFFLWVHYLDPHAPYGPPPVADTLAHEALMRAARESPSTKERESARQRVRQAYEAEVRYCDDWIGKLLRYLDESGLADRTLVILTADHGEGFWEGDALEHGGSFARAVMQVPLVIAFPDRRHAGLRVDEPARLLDVLPTVLDVASVATPSHVRGTSLLPLLEGSSEPREVLAECRYLSPEQKVLRSGSLVVVYTPETGSLDYYDDDGVSLRRAEAAPPESSPLEDRLREWSAEMTLALSRTAAEAGPLPADVRRELEALGYL